MSLLVPDYSSSSEDEAQPSRALQSYVQAPVPPPPSTATKLASLALLPPATAVKKPTKKRKVAKKPKTALFLHPDIQRLLESGSSRSLGDDSDSDDDAATAGGDSTSLLAKQKKAMAAKRPRTANADGERESSGLSFLPAPKHVIEEPKANKHTQDITEVVADAHEAAQPQEYAVSQETTGEAYDGAIPSDAAATAQYQQQQQYYEGYTDPSQYAYYQQQQEQYYYPSTFEGEEDTSSSSSKRARNRERELERALQQGHFHSVASKIIEVQGPAPNAWQPPVDVTRSNEQNNDGVKVQASFWNAQAGAKVTTVKPNRMQRQKHQLNQLAFDAKLREHELLDKKGTSLKTKAETHAKYGW